MMARVLKAKRCPVLAGARLRLSWWQLPYRHSDLTESRLRITAVLRRPWGSANPGAFNYRVWLLSKQIRATGYIKHGVRLYSADEPFQASSSYVYDGVSRALARGERGGVGDNLWATFRDTGTIHLMVVSGLHVGIYAGVIGGLALFVLRLLPCHHLRLYGNAWVALAALIGVMLYAWQVGPAAPVVRAALGVLLLTVLFLLHRRASVAGALVLVCLVTVWLQPHFVLQQGFWLSFGAVFVLSVTLLTQRRPPSYVYAFLVCQMALFMALSPLTAHLTGNAPLLAPLANLLVVPPMSAVIIPGTLLSMQLDTLLNVELLENVIAGLRRSLDVALHVVVSLLRSLAALHVNLGNLSFAPALVAGILGIAVLLPVTLPLRVVVFAAWISVWLPVGSGLNRGDFRVLVADVGQGSAALIDTARHRVLVDAGPRVEGGFDAGEAVVRPVIERTGISRIRLAVISHADNDHAGGLAAVEEKVVVAETRTAERGCRGALTIDKVTFTLLRSRESSTSRNRNDASCTVLVQGRIHSAYLPGDISQQTELELLARLPPRIDLLLVAHHGSKTSSHPAFLKRLKPRWGVISAGRSNRYGHPHAVVVQRLRAHGIQVLTTAESGALVWTAAGMRQYRSRSGAYYLPLVSEAD